MAEPELLIIHTDGASRGNPGAAAYAYTIERDGEELIAEAGCLGRMTNNQAEYTALVHALEHALEYGPQNRLLIHSDSELLVKQMNGQYRVKDEGLRDLYEQAQRLRRQFEGTVTIRHVRREQNSRADGLCNEALDGKRVPVPRSLSAAALKPVGAPKAVPAATATASLREEAVDCLRAALRGEVATADDLWSDLGAILRRHGVRLPPEEGGK